MNRQPPATVQRLPRDEPLWGRYGGWLLGGYAVTVLATALLHGVLVPHISADLWISTLFVAVLISVPCAGAIAFGLLPFSFGFRLIVFLVSLAVFVATFLLGGFAWMEDDLGWLVESFPLACLAAPLPWLGLRYFGGWTVEFNTTEDVRSENTVSLGGLMIYMFAFAMTLAAVGQQQANADTWLFRVAIAVGVLGAVTLQAPIVWLVWRNVRQWVLAILIVVFVGIVASVLLVALTGLSVSAVVAVGFGQLIFVGALLLPLFAIRAAGGQLRTWDH